MMTEQAIATVQLEKIVYAPRNKEEHIARHISILLVKGTFYYMSINL